MRAISTCGAVIALLALSGGARAQDEKQWREAAKAAIVAASDHVEMRVKGDAEAIAGAKRLRDELLKDAALAHVAKELKKKFDTDTPTPEKMKEFDAAVRKQLDDINLEDLKKRLKAKVRPLEDPLPCPPLCFPPEKK